MRLDETYVSDLRRIAAAIKNPPWDLCQFCEGQSRASEREYMICETVFAAIKNLEGEPKEPFSWIGANAKTNHYGRHAMNGEAFEGLLEQRYIVEEERDGKPVMFLTRLALELLLRHLKLPAEDATPNPV